MVYIENTGLRDRSGFLQIGSQLLIGLQFYSTLKLYLVTIRIADLVPSKFLDSSH